MCSSDLLVAGCYRVKGKSTSATESTHSLLNWLVAGAGQSPPAWFESKNDPATIAAAWHRLATRAGPHLAVSPLPIESGTPVPATRPLPEMFEALTPPRHMPPGWWIGSYSGLVSGWESSATHEQAAADHDLRVGPTEASATTTAVRLDDDDILRFPRGPAAGVCLHSVFERIDFSNPAGWPSAITAALRSLHADGPAVDSRFTFSTMIRAATPRAMPALSPARLRAFSKSTKASENSSVAMPSWPRSS